MKVRVQMMHPDWSEQAVSDEVKAIQAEFGQPALDPDSLGAAVPGFGDSYDDSSFEDPPEE